MANAWIEHVRRWSAANGVSYMCAISKPECKAAYKGKKPAAKAEAKAEAKPAMKEDKKVITGKKIKVPMSQLYPVETPAKPIAEQKKPILDYRAEMKTFKTRNAINASKYPRMNMID